MSERRQEEGEDGHAGDTEDSARHDRRAHAEEGRDHTGFEVPEQGPARVAHLLDSRQPAAEPRGLVLQRMELAAASEESDNVTDHRDDDAVGLVDDEQPFNVDEDDEELAKLDDALKAADAVNKDIENDPGRTTS